MIRDHFKNGNLHHAYLIEGEHAVIFPEIVKIVEDWGVKTSGNPDFCSITVDSFKIEDARNLKSLTSERGITKSKKVFVISANNFLLEAQNALLKMFEEPAIDTHFFLILPDAGVLIKTLASRFHYIAAPGEPESKDAKKFVLLSKRERIDFLKELLAEDEEEVESGRSKAAKFLNELETFLHAKGERNVGLFEQIFKARKYLRQPGSSTKNLLESVALML